MWIHPCLPLSLTSYAQSVRKSCGLNFTINSDSNHFPSPGLLLPRSKPASAHLDYRNSLRTGLPASITAPFSKSLLQATIKIILKSITSHPTSPLNPLMAAASPRKTPKGFHDQQTRQVRLPLGL